jgi:hypothetical protein
MVEVRHYRIGIALSFLLLATTVYAAPSYGQSVLHRVYPSKAVAQPVPTRTVGIGKNDSARAASVKTVVDRILRRFQVRIDNYSLFLDKVQTRRDKLADEGKDVSTADRFITSAHANLDSAKSALSAAKSVLDALDYTKSLKDIRSVVTTQLQTVREAMTALHSSVSQVVASERAATVSK